MRSFIVCGGHTCHFDSIVILMIVGVRARDKLEWMEIKIIAKLISTMILFGIFCDSLIFATPMTISHLLKREFANVDILGWNCLKFGSGLSLSS